MMRFFVPMYRTPKVPLVFEDKEPEVRQGWLVRLKEWWRR